MEQSITGRFIDSIWRFSKEKYPQEIISDCRICLLDYIACASYGASLLRKQIDDVLDSFGSADGKVSVIGTGRKTDMLNAALLNGVSAHEAELDDGHRYAMLHPGAPVISAVLAVAQGRECDANSILRGIVTGYEATIRLAGSIQPEHKLKGYHATGTCGTIGAAIGVAAMLDCPKEWWNTIVSAAATSASGLLQVMDDRSEFKPYNAGKAAQSAVAAGAFGMSGFRGPEDVLGGKRGFFAAMAGKVNEDYLLNGSGRYAIQGIYRKPYASCRHSHAAIEAALNICKREKFSAADVRKIEITTYDLAVKGHDHTRIEGASSARMSIPYGVSAAVRFGRVDFQQYEEGCLKDPVLNELMGKISVEGDPELSKLVPEKRAAIVRIITDRGEFMERVDYPLGEPENPMNQQMMENKYRAMMEAAGRTAEDTDVILEGIKNFETKRSMLFERM